MDSEKVIKRDNEYVLHTYGRNPVVLEKGHGLYAEGPEGQKYLDFTSGIGVNSLGYCDLTWAEAVSKQAHKLQHTSNLYYTAPCGKLAKKLCKRTGMSKVFFGNSGAEANEGAIKAARKYSVDHYSKDRTTVITLVNSFHGRTIATLTATGQEVFHNYFGPFNEGFLYAPAGDMEALQELVDRNTCAVMLELIQGEGGVMPLDEAYVKGAAKLCEQYDLLLICDEVQVGNGRSGKLYGYMHYGVQPDIVSTAKGLAGGLPLGATLDVVTRGGESGLDAAERIKRTFPQMKIIIVTSMPECSYLSRAREIGVESFWYKEEQRESLLDVMARTMAGESVYPDATPELQLGLASSYQFTSRELEVLREMTGGDTNQEIAERLHMSVATVKTHILNMLEKTGFRNRTELAVRAREIGLVILNRKN